MKKFLLVSVAILLLLGLFSCFSYYEQPEPKTFKVIMLNEDICMITNNYRATSFEQLKYEMIKEMALVTIQNGYKYFTLLNNKSWYEGGVIYYYYPSKQFFTLRNLESHVWDKMGEGFEEGANALAEGLRRAKDIERRTKKWFISCTIKLTNEKIENIFSAQEILNSYNE